ncbi:MAG: OPT/YSL family transporter [Steroidobacteraceae bacterium]
MLLGSMISWNVAIPIFQATALGAHPDLAAAIAGPAGRLAGRLRRSTAGILWSKQIRYLGVGAMLVGGIWARWCRCAIRSSRASRRPRRGTRHNSGPIAHDQDLPMKSVLAGIVLFYAAAVGAVPGHRRVAGRQPP